VRQQDRSRGVSSPRILGGSSSPRESRKAGALKEGSKAQETLRRAQCRAQSATVWHMRGGFIEKALNRTVWLLDASALSWLLAVLACLALQVKALETA